MHINNVWHSFQKKDFCSFSFGSDGTDFSRLATLRAKHKHAGWGLPVWPPSTQHVQVNGREQGGTSDAELLALALLSQETHYHYYKLQDKPRLRQSIKWAWSWGKKGTPHIWCLQKITGLLMRITLAFLKQTVIHTCSVILWCVASALLLECHLTYSAASGYIAHASPAKCAHVSVPASVVYYVA